MIDSWVPTASHRVGAEPVRELLDPRHALVSTLLDDVGRAELERELLAGRVAAHRDDPFRTELPRGEHGEQADRAVADDGNGLPRAGLGGQGPEPAGAEHIGGGEEARDQVLGRRLGGGHEGAVGERDPGSLGLCPDAPHELAVDARALVAGPADLARVVRGPERPDDELPGCDRPDGVADFLDDADVLVTEWDGSLDGLDAPVGHRSEPQMQVAGSRMIASVGSMIFGSSRSSRRTSRGPYMTAPRIVVSS
jgi:hypothetical protein